MAEEFTESEVVFSDFEDCNEEKEEEEEEEKLPLPSPQQQNEKENSSVKSEEVVEVRKSEPVNIPEKKVQAVEEDGEVMVPPHEILRRRLAGKMTFSVCTGIGRTLKGRDLSQVRNFILRLTGFLEV